MAATCVNLVAAGFGYGSSTRSIAWLPPVYGLARGIMRLNGGRTRIAEDSRDGRSGAALQSVSIREGRNMAAIRSKAASRFDPYKNFKFKLVWDGRTVGAFNALTPVHVLKITGMNKSTDVTLKRGVIGDPGLFDWLNRIRGGRA